MPLRPLRGSGFALGQPGAFGAGAFPLRGFAPPSRSSFRKFWIFCISPLRIGVEYDTLCTMKTQLPKKDRDELLKRLAALVPFAKGSVCVSHKDPVGVLAEALKAYKPRFRRGMTA